MADILIIDDDELLRALVALKLAGAGHRVRTAGDGGAGLAAARAEVPDLIVLDAMMPVMTGPEVLGEIRRDRALAAVPVIFLSARTAAADIAEARLGGADDYLTKPFVPEELAARCKAMLGLVRRDAA